MTETAEAQNPRGALLTVAEAAALLNVPETWLRKRVSERRVPFALLGRHIRFTESHLDRIISDAEQFPLDIAPHGLTRRARPRRAV
ncbi:MAG TPA: helix-turn-helix domain-containing protein [Mycobacteriales bacterium]|nr:helix-turn-helix domain-containing protein [Mycobacteriales bacterium]